MVMRCRVCKREVPEVPYLSVRGLGPLCWADFRVKRRGVRRSWFRRLLSRVGVL